MSRSDMYVFGYASLVAFPQIVPARLRDHRRVWGVAMDNRVAVPGYKVYEQPDGSRPAASVAFLDLEPAPGVTIDGALLAVDAEALDALDTRERQYERVDVTALIEPTTAASCAPVFAYVGRPAARARVTAGRVVIQRAYRDRVEAAFSALGPDALARYRATTEPPPFDVVDLARVEV